MTQPIWKYIANLGDADPITYGGLFVYSDATGAYAPELERVEPDDSDAPHNWTVHRFALDRCTFAGGVLSDNPYHPDHPAWFAKSIRSVASSLGIQAAELIAGLTGDDILARARAYESIASFHGWDNFDEYPLTFNRAEIEARYPQFA